MNLLAGVFTPGLRAEPGAEAGGWDKVELRAAAPLRRGAAGGSVWMRGRRDAAAQGSLTSLAGWLSTTAAVMRLVTGCKTVFGIYWCPVTPKLS